MHTDVCKTPEQKISGYLPDPDFWFYECKGEEQVL